MPTVFVAERRLRQSKRQRLHSVRLNLGNHHDQARVGARVRACQNSDTSKREVVLSTFLEEAALCLSILI